MIHFDFIHQGFIALMDNFLSFFHIILFIITLDTIFFYPDLSKKENVFLPDEEVQHLRTLRIQKGECIRLTDAKGRMADAEIISPNAKKFEVKIINIWQIESKRPFHIHIAVAPTKNIERIEWFLEKAIEIGIDEITFLQTEHSERKQINSERLFRKALAAMKQSMQVFLPQINGLTPLNTFLKDVNANQKFVAHIAEGYQKTPLLTQKAEKNKRYCIMIGAEGGFSENEIQASLVAGFECVSLGENRLRTETAALTSCISLHLIHQLSSS